MQVAGSKLAQRRASEQRRPLQKRFDSPLQSPTSACSNKPKSPHQGFILDKSRCAEVVDFAKTSRLYRKIFGIATKNEILAAPRNSFMSLNEID